MNLNITEKRSELMGGLNLGLTRILSIMMNLYKIMWRG